MNYDRWIIAGGIAGAMLAYAGLAALDYLVPVDVAKNGVVSRTLFSRHIFFILITLSGGAFLGGITASLMRAHKDKKSEVSAIGLAKLMFVCSAIIVVSSVLKAIGNGNIVFMWRGIIICLLPIICGTSLLVQYQLLKRE